MASAISPSSSFSLEKEKFVLVAKDLSDILGLECEVCKEPFSLDEKTPKLLPCNHTLCCPCLRQLTTQQCPICRSTYQTYYENLPTDFKVVRGLDAIKKAQGIFKNVCMKHNCLNLDKFCSTCWLPVCEDCVRLSHDEDGSHIIIEMAKAFEDNASRFSDMENKCKESLKQLKKREEVTENVKNNLDVQQEELIRKVEDKFNEYNNLLTERKESLKNMIKNKTEQRKTEMTAESKRLEETTNTVKILNDSFKASRESGNVREIFALQKRFIDEEKDLVQTFSNEELCVSYDFFALNEERFKTDLAAVGDVMTKLDVGMMTY